MFSTFRTTIYLLILLIVLGVNSSAIASEMSSKRDCVVCHIMWMDSFRSDKETLIEWQPGNVLMKDTQGVVSSEEICYTCHDGYVNDSRYIVWKYNRHKTGVKPSKNVKVPVGLTLSVKGEVYCGTCHSAHSLGAEPHGPEGKTSFFRVKNIDSSLCEMCHKDKAAYNISNSHPVGTTALKLPNLLFESGSKKAIDRDRVICESCHKVHGAKGDKILIVDNKTSELCMICHEKQKSLVETKHDLRLTLPDEKNIKQQPVSESGPCGACHTPHNSAGKKLWARKLNPGNPATQMCLTCHGEDTPFKTKHIGKYSHPINVDPNSKEAIPGELPLFLGDGLKDPAGKVQCFTCHNVHRWDPDFLTNKGGKDVEGNSLNSFLRISNISSNLCLKCHTDKKPLISSDHNLEATAPKEKNIQGFTAAVSGPCGVCHIPHNAASNRLWAKKLSENEALSLQLCNGCHNRKGAAKAKLIGDIYHPVSMDLKKLGLTTSLPLYDNKGRKIPDGKVVCLTCHEPHIWDPNKAVSDYTFENMEGDASNSFLRKSNVPYSDLCGDCHKDKTFIDLTDHDLNITAPEATNLLGRTVKESGQCGVCHVVHNSPNKLKLWARPYGPILANESIMNALCNSCHSNGNIAEKKIPPIASHPEKKLINNIMKCDRNALDYFPLYDKNGKEVTVGNISCPSCHNAHQWSPTAKQKGPGKNLEGTASNSFLRNVSYNTICMDCHGFDALFRYKDFHDPAGRIEDKMQIKLCPQSG